MQFTKNPIKNFEKLVTKLYVTQKT